MIMWKFEDVVDVFGRIRRDGKATGEPGLSNDFVWPMFPGFLLTKYECTLRNDGTWNAIASWLEVLPSSSEEAKEKQAAPDHITVVSGEALRCLVCDEVLLGCAAMTVSFGGPQVCGKCIDDCGRKVT